MQKISTLSFRAIAKNLWLGIGCWVLDAGCWMQEVGSWKREAEKNNTLVIRTFEYKNKLLMAVAGHW